MLCGPPRRIREEAILRPRKPEVLTQRPAFVVAPEEAAPLQLGHHAIDEVVEALGYLAVRGTSRSKRSLSQSPLPAAISGDVNHYLREISGEEFTANDFRTWAGTVLADASLNRLEPPRSKAGPNGTWYA